MSYRRSVPDLALTTRGTWALQVTVALPLLVPHLAGEGFASVLAYYGLVVLTLPTLVGWIVGTPLDPYQRTILTVGIGLHGHGILLDFYWRVWWFDVITHAFSGALLAAGCYALVLAAAGSVDRRPGPWVHALAFGMVFVGGVTWEVYEVLAPWQTIYPTGDALKDMVMNSVGYALVAALHPRLLGDVPDALAGRLVDWRRAWHRWRRQ